MEFSNLSNFEEFKANPSYLLLFIDKYVEVKLVKNTTLSGFIHSIDPLDYSIIILVEHEDTFQTTLIPGHAILDVCVKEPEANVKIPFKKPTNLSTSSVIQKKQKVLQWLKENLLPVSELDENIVFQNVTILPPYNVTDICTDNPMVAMQLVNIMTKMPKDYNPT